MLAGGVALYATNEFLTISLLPVSADIRGQPAVRRSDNPVSGRVGVVAATTVQYDVAARRGALVI